MTDVLQRAPTVALAVAYRADDEQRIANWRWVGALLAEHVPEWSVYEEAGTSSYWNKQRALNEAIARAADADVVVLYDSDCFAAPAHLRELVALAQGSARWAVPTRTVRLTRQATRRVLASEPVMPTLSPSDHALIHPMQENALAEVPIPIVEPLGVIQQSALCDVGVFDDSPWTYQEWWAGMALETLIGPPAVLDVDVYHL